MGKLQDYLNSTPEARKALRNQKKNKYNVNKSKANGFDSFFESQVCDNLDRMKKYYDFEHFYHKPEHNIHWWTFNKWTKRYEALGLTREDICNDKIHHIYEPDFLIILPNGHKIYLETKGWLDSSDRTKMKRVKELYPELDIRFVFQKKQNLKINNNQTNVQWAMANDFPVCVGGLLPKDWFKI